MAIDVPGPDAALSCILGILNQHFPDHPTDFLRALFGKIADLFDGRYEGYQACDTVFHDFSHTYQASVATARILDGHMAGGFEPRLTARDYELGIAGIWLHDIGFLKTVGDHPGTGAKYTLVHVDRSVQFADWFLPLFGVTADETRIVQQAIRCTGTNVNTAEIPFHNDRERLIGYALGAGDILGQMAAPDYPDKLPRLYSEFQEAGLVAHDRTEESYDSARDLLAKTRQFFEGCVVSMLRDQWGSVDQRLPSHFADGRNHYMEAIAQNLDRIDRLLAED
jgi:hypothetical protein